MMPMLYVRGEPLRDVQVALELGESEASMHASIRAMQLDDQSLDAQQPVVLGPASTVSKGTNQCSCHERVHGFLLRKGSCFVL